MGIPLTAAPNARDMKRDFDQCMYIAMIQDTAIITMKRQ